MVVAVTPYWQHYRTEEVACSLVTKIGANNIKPKEDVIVNTPTVSGVMNISYSQYRYELKIYVEKIISEAILENIV